MKKTLILGVTAITFMLFSCGETTTPEELENQVTEIAAEQEELEEINADIDAIENAVSDLDSDLEGL